MIIIGHRGAMGYEPENTLRSFQKAINLQVDMVEFDVHICKSGELVVIHDEKVDRTTNGQGFVAQKTLDEIKKLDTGKGEKIPTLEEVLNLIDKQIKVNIELKGVNTAKETFKIIKKYIEKKDWTYNNFLVSSFNHKELEKIHKLDQKIKIGILVDNINKENVTLAHKLNAFSINPDIEKIDNEIIKKIHQEKFKVIVWSFKSIENLNNLNIDGAFLNYPDQLNS